MSKHRRVCRSSSAGEIGVSRFRPIESPAAYWEAKRPAQGRSVQKGADVKNRKPPAVDPAPEMNKDRRCAFTIGSSDDAGTVSNKICAAEFLQNCFLCKKNLKPKDDLFMYGCLGAFCSPDCRDSQMALDGFEKEVSRELTKKLTAGNLKKKDMPRQWLGNQQQNQV